MRHLCQRCGKLLRVTCPKCASLNVRHNTVGGYYSCGNCYHGFHATQEVKSEICNECAVRLRRERQNGGI